MGHPLGVSFCPTLGHLYTPSVPGTLNIPRGAGGMCKAPPKSQGCLLHLPALAPAPMWA